MITHCSKSTDSGGPEKDETTDSSPGEAGKDDACRCKQAAEMSPGELLKLMAGDLAFWKKLKKK